MGLSRIFFFFLSSPRFFPSFAHPGGNHACSFAGALDNTYCVYGGCSLVLSHNAITSETLARGVFSGSNLTLIDLSFNSLETVDSGMFAGRVRPNSGLCHWWDTPLCS